MGESYEESAAQVDANALARRRKRRRARRSRARQAPGETPTSATEAAAQVLEAARLLVRQVASRFGVEPGDALPIERLTLPVALSFGGGDSGADADALVRALTGRLDEVLRAANGFRSGEVFCFQCNVPGCAHASPARPDETFAGYTATGKPLMQGFAGLCIERGEERVARIYDDPPQVVALVQSAAELRAGQMAHFGGDGRSLTVLGQVVAGLLPEIYDPLGDRRARVAVAFQVVETPGSRGAHRLRLNLLGTSWPTLADVVSGEGPAGRAASLTNALSVFRRHLRALGRTLERRERRGEEVDVAVALQPALNDLRRDIERIFRGHRFRTQHANVRRNDGDRPTMAAQAEARAAPEHRLLFDVQRQTIVVVGKKSRAHVFSLDGWHVTSLQLRPNEIGRKTERGRWRALDPERIVAFRQALTQQQEETAASSNR